MVSKKYVKFLLVLGLVSLAIGGYLLHSRIHFPGPGKWRNLVPLVSGILSVLVIPWFFLFRRTLHLGYLLNGMSVILGTIMMAHFSLVRLDPGFTLADLVFRTTFADISLLWGKFFLGRAIFHLEMYPQDAVYKPGVRVFRYPHTGWWLVHLCVMSFVYWLGNTIWR